MVEITISFNIGLALFCLALAWQLHQFKKKVRRATRALVIAEQKTHYALDRAPVYIAMGQAGTQQLRQSIARLEPLQQGLANLSVLLGVLTWIRGSRRKPQKKA